MLYEIHAIDGCQCMRTATAITLEIEQPYSGLTYVNVAQLDLHGGLIFKIGLQCPVCP